MVKSEQLIEVELDECLEELEEVNSYLGKTVDIRGDEGQTRGEDHIDKLIEELAVDDKVEFFKDNGK